MKSLGLSRYFFSTPSWEFVVTWALAVLQLEVKLIAKLLTNTAKLEYSQRVNGSFFNFSFEQVFHGGEAGWGSGLKPWTLCSLVWWCRKIISKYFSVIVRKSYFSMVTTHNKKKILVSDKAF